MLYTTWRILTASAIALLLVFAFTDGARAQSQEHEGDHGMKEKAAQRDDVVHPQRINGVQVVEIEVGKMDYSAKKIALEAGVPARLIFTRTEDGGCTHRVQIPAFGVEATNLPLNEPVSITFTPDEGGTFTFVCAMNMVEGTLLVRS